MNTSLRQLRGAPKRVWGHEGVRWALCAALAVVGAAIQAAPVVVTPGSNAGYLYFPPAAAGGGGSSTPTVNSGTGGIQVIKGYGSDTNIGFTVTIAGQTCNSTCQTKRVNTGSGFVTVTTSVPVNWQSAIARPSGSATSTCTNGQTTCQIWVTEGQSVDLTVYVVKQTWRKDTTHAVNGPGGQVCAQSSTQCDFYYSGSYQFTLSTPAWTVGPSTTCAGTPPLHGGSLANYGTITTTPTVQTGTSYDMCSQGGNNGCGPGNTAACTQAGQVMLFGDGTMGSYVPGGPYAYAVHGKLLAGGGGIQWGPFTDTALANYSTAGAAQGDWNGQTNAAVATAHSNKCAGSLGVGWRAPSAGEAYRVLLQQAQVAYPGNSAGNSFYFWTSTEANATLAWLIPDWNTTLITVTKDSTSGYYQTMCVRSQN